jgi:L-iditol 2-dehydrogenase
MKMKAAFLTGIKKIEIAEVTAPGIEKDTDVLIRVLAVGVCGSDIHYYSEGKIGDQVVAYPFIVGHEMTGIVERAGDAVTRVKRGDRVVVDPAIHCARCSQCRQGRFHTCMSLVFLGCPGQKEGCLCELIVMPESCCFPVPDSVSDDDGVICEPLSIGLHAMGLSGASPDAAIGILGCGPIGLSVLASAGVVGSRRIYATDILDYRRVAAERMGARLTCNPARDDTVRVIRSTEREGLDIVFECSGSQAALDEAVRLLKPGGKLMIVGIPSTDRWSFAAHDARRIELCIQHVRRQNERTLDAIHLVSDRANTMTHMVTHHFPLDDTRAAFELVSGYSDGVIKAVIRVTPD